MHRWLLVLLAVAACSRPSEENEAKNWPKQLPPPTKDLKDLNVPADLSISVTVDGAPKPAITADTLKSTKPDFADTDRRAWRIPSLVADATPTGSVEASSPSGISVKFAHPTHEPVLFLTRRGEVIIAAVDPKDPFPGHHGQGGRLHRPGDSDAARREKVSKLDIKRAP
jgi:hypothetical protein